jgi:formiminotetrahydrofolate cyclodeaminase
MLDQSIREYLAKLSSDAPTPGGGFAAGVMAAQGASLILMATELSKKQLEETKLSEIREKLISLRDECLALAEKDSEEFAKLMNCFSMKKDDPNRAVSLQKAYVSCAEVPLSLCQSLKVAIPCAEELLKNGNSHLASDVKIGLINLRAASESCRYNVEANAPYIKDQTIKNRITEGYENANSEILSSVAKIMS